MSAPRGIVRPDSDFPYGDDRHGIVCTRCGADVEADLCTTDGASEILLSPCCEVVVRPSRPDQRGLKKIARRWGEDVARTGFTVEPDVLTDHLDALGLTPLDFFLLHCIERRRRDRPEAWEDERTLAEKAGVSPGHARKRLHRMRSAGLIEWTRERGYGGRWEHRVYTRYGLAAACQLIAANRRADRPDLAGVAELLAELRHRASARGGSTDPPGAVVTTDPPGAVEVPPASSPPILQEQHHRASRSTTTDPGGATKQSPSTEALEADSPNGASDAHSRADAPHEDDESEAW